jgi:hypothetical protein
MVKEIFLNFRYSLTYNFSFAIRRRALAVEGDKQKSEAIKIREHSCLGGD